LTVGCLWGAINVLQIAMGKSFLQLRLLPSIHAHAQAMIFGWVGMFVMGFAYTRNLVNSKYLRTGSMNPRYV
jgi:hypothetical protein